MAELEKPQHPLEVLPAMLNLILVQTGKFFREAASREPKDAVATRKFLKEVGQSANNRFHEALDELEIEITRAKAVFERDLRKVRAKRAEREKAAGTLTRPAGVVKNRSPSAEIKKSPRASSVKGSEENVKFPDEVVDDHDQAGDQTMVNGNGVVDAAQSSTTEPPATAPEAPTQNGLNENETAVPSENAAENKKPANASASKAQDTKPEESAAQPNSPKKPQPETIPAPAPEELSTNQEAAPFESMFDLEQGNNGNGLDFDLGLSDGQDLLNDPLFEDVGMPSNNQNADLNATSAEDINTLLPGLENYVNDSGDFSMIELPEGTMAQEATMTNGTTAGADGTTAATNYYDGAASTQGMEMPMESNFDDLFGSGDWAGDGDMGDGAMVDFDDDWFKTDG